MTSKAHSHTLSLSLFITHILARTHTHTLSLSLYHSHIRTHTNTHTHTTLSLSLSHTHTQTHRDTLLTIHVVYSDPPPSPLTNMYTHIPDARHRPLSQPEESFSRNRTSWPRMSVSSSAALAANACILIRYVLSSVTCETFLSLHVTRLIRV